MDMTLTCVTQCLAKILTFCRVTTKIRHFDIQDLVAYVVTVFVIICGFFYVYTNILKSEAVSSGR